MFEPGCDASLYDYCLGNTATPEGLATSSNLVCSLSGEAERIETPCHGEEVLPADQARLGGSFGGGEEIVLTFSCPDG